MFRHFGVGLAAATIAAAIVLVGAVASGADNPKLLWKTIETRHFRVTYYSTEDEVAKHVAALAEAIYERLVPAVGWAPGERTEIALTDQTDVANGSATALPYDAVRLYVTAPDDMSPLGDVDDWYLELITHEYTHILHTDHITGIPALLNRILGKTFAPNQVAPRLASRGTGRLRGERPNERRPPSLLDVEHVDARRRARGQRRSTRRLLQHASPLAAGQHLVPLRLVLLAVDRRDLRRASHTGDDRRLRRQDHPVRDQSVDAARDGKTFEELYARGSTAPRSFGAQAAAIRERGLARRREGHAHRKHRRASALDPVEGVARQRAGDLMYFVDDDAQPPRLLRAPPRS